MSDFYSRSMVHLCFKALIDLDKTYSGNFPSDPVVKNLPCNAEDVGWIPGRGTKIPQATRQLSPNTATTELQCSGADSPQLESLHATMRDAV